MQIKYTLILALCVGAGCESPQSDSFESPDILILGDSQILFGSGPAYLNFFASLETHCADGPQHISSFRKLHSGKAAVIGVRSSSLHSWTARSGKAKDRICEIDPKWPINASAFGHIKTNGEKYFQIGDGEAFKFCIDHRSPIEVMFAQDYYRPTLLVLSFLGNAARRWADDKALATTDVEALVQQLPDGIPCVFMTTAPSYSSKRTQLRRRAQENLHRAFIETGSRCAFVPGITEQTIAANQGNKSHFRLRKSGKVRDPFHPNSAAATNFLALRGNDLCNAITAQLVRIASQPNSTSQSGRVNVWSEE